MKTKENGGRAGGDRMTAEEIKRRNLEGYGRKIKAARKRAGVSAEELAARLGVSRGSVRNWECGLTRPDLESLCRLFEVLDTEPNDFFGIPGSRGLKTEEERRLVSAFRRLDGYDRAAALRMLGALEEASGKRRLAALSKTMRSVATYGRAAAAGSGEEWDGWEEPVGVLLYAGPEVSLADEVMTVSGDSMEPKFHDGDRILVQYAGSIPVGETGVFFVPGWGGVIKEVRSDRLHSLNPAFDDIIPNEEGARPVGRVLCAVTPEMVPGEAEQRAWRQAAEAAEA